MTNRALLPVACRLRRSGRVSEAPAEIAAQIREIDRVGFYSADAARPRHRGGRPLLRERTVLGKAVRGRDVYSNRPCYSRTAATQAVPYSGRRRVPRSPAPDRAVAQVDDPGAECPPRLDHPRELRPLALRNTCEVPVDRRQSTPPKGIAHERRSTDLGSSGDSRRAGASLAHAHEISGRSVGPLRRRERREWRRRRVVRREDAERFLEGSRPTTPSSRSYRGSSRSSLTPKGTKRGAGSAAAPERHPFLQNVRISRREGLRPPFRRGERFNSHVVVAHPDRRLPQTGGS